MNYYCICCDKTVEQDLQRHSKHHNTCTENWIEYIVDLNQLPYDCKNLAYIYGKNEDDDPNNSWYYDWLCVENLEPFKGIKTWEEAKDIFYKLKVFK